MTVPAHLVQFIEFNTAARVLLLCRAKGVVSQQRINVFTRALNQAVIAGIADETTQVTEVDALINAQLELLSLALDRPPPPRLPPRAQAAVEEMLAEEKEIEPPPKIRRRRTRNITGAVEADSKSREQKLEDERKPLRTLLQEDCVRLGLVQQDRAKQLSRTLAGRLREDAEKDLVAELRNNLHTQIRTYMRKRKGGPWDSPKIQEEVRLDIEHTNSVHALVSLTRRLLTERKAWEKTADKGILGNLLAGKIRFGSGKK